MLMLPLMVDFTRGRDLLIGMLLTCRCGDSTFRHVVPLLGVHRHPSLFLWLLVWHMP